MTTRRYKLDSRIHPSQTQLLRENFANAGWTQTEGPDWNLFWSNAVHDREVFAAVRDGQLVNHFSGIAPMFFKDELAHFLELAGHTFHPRTFSMPWRYDDLRSAMSADPTSLWLAKKKRSMNGDGMGIITDETLIPRDDEWLVQRYVSNPLLLPDYPYKHMLRQYVLVTSIDPLVAHIHPTGGLAKFTSRPFSLTAEALRDPVVHITNQSVQTSNLDASDAIRAIDIPEYRQLLEQAAIDPGPIFKAIAGILRSTLLALHEPVLELSRQWSPRLDCSFELLGFDLMIDDTLKPWVLECNISPGLGAYGIPGSAALAAQRSGKEQMVTDMLSAVGVIDRAHAFEPLI